MAKDNLFLGMARGKVGDVVFTRLNGTQVSRVRNRAPRNPQTPIQLLQRVVMKTCSSAYSMMADICDHSFQGISGKTPNQSRFLKVNIEMLRSQLAELINSGDPEDIFNSDAVNFSRKQSTLPALNPYIVSEGSIAPLSYSWSVNIFMIQGVNPVGSATTVSYRMVIESLGLQRGDQLTFLGFSIDDTTDAGFMNGFRYARVILDPANGDLDSEFSNSSGVIQSPNERNEGDVIVQGLITSSQPLKVAISFPDFSNAAGAANSICAVAVIVSRQSGNLWQRSTQSLVMRSSSDDVSGHLTENHYLEFLGDAVQSYLTQQNSSLYLNQAENF